MHVIAVRVFSIHNFFKNRSIDIVNIFKEEGEFDAYLQLYASAITRGLFSLYLSLL